MTVYVRAPGEVRVRLHPACSIGMARLGAAVWTGDLAHLWEHLARTPGNMLKWALAGAPYVTCDIGGFLPTIREDPDLVVRWYQVGVFMPIMRVHSMINAKPRFPWLWGETHAKVMRQALELRYRLLPYHYSLAHAMYSTGKLWTQPLAMAFPSDIDAAAISTQWMDGELLVAPVLHPSSRKEVYLPAGEWYALNNTIITQGPSRLQGGAELSEVPVFVRRGTVLPLAPVVQHTDALPGGALEVQVYGGADGVFKLVEDDGATTAYESGEVRSTRLAWDDARRTLSWTTRGADAGPQAFRELFVTLFEPSGVQRSSVHPLGQSGSVRLREPASKTKAFLSPEGGASFDSIAKPHIQG
uniref:DUF5110 domain-containing protein n=1 Tax=Alexandrium monilatum TaxID=311494 RepID=A0A7S4Q967_9DINO